MSTKVTESLTLKVKLDQMSTNMAAKVTHRSRRSNDVTIHTLFTKALMMTSPMTLVFTHLCKGDEDDVTHGQKGFKYIK
jgi:hypothetical protein